MGQKIETRCNLSHLSSEACVYDLLKVKSYLTSDTFF